jgi:hypothetical protein
VLWTTTASTVLVSVVVLLAVWRPSPPMSGSPVAGSMAPAPSTKSPAPPEVSVSGREIAVDGVRCGSTAEIASAGRVVRVDALFAALRERRLMTGDRSTRVNLTVEPDVPALVVKSVFQTVAFAGYPDVELAAVPTSPGAPTAARSAPP